jgi:dTDP-4-dehydrorhamnose reductase
VNNQGRASPRACLVVGGDGLIGRALFDRLVSSGMQVRRTTRRAQDVDELCFRLDLDRLDLASRAMWDFIQAEKPMIFFAASVTGFRQCEDEPEATRRINVTNTLTMGERCLRAGCAFVYLSSNAVFSGDTPSPQEQSPPDPKSEYGKQKVAVEKGLERLTTECAGSAIAVVRLTKVVPDASGLIQSWIAALKRGETIHALEDYIFSPVSLSVVIHMLAKLPFLHKAGVFHVSGSRDLSYYDFAVLMARALGAHVSRVVPQRSRDGVSAFRIRHTALGMTRTCKELGLIPQAPELTINDILSGASRIESL